METRTADDVAVISTPVDLHTRIHSFHRRASLVQTFELFGGAGDRRETPQVFLLLDTHGLAIALTGIANRRHGTFPVFVFGRAAVLQGAPFGFVADVGHRVPYGWVAHLVITVQRSGLIVD